MTLDDAAKKKLLDKIQKLFALGDSARNSSEAEVMLAVTKARQLMAEHGLTMIDLEALGDSERAKTIRINIETNTCYVRAGSRFAVYDDYVAAAVGEICSVRSLTRRFYEQGQKVSRVFVGDEADVHVAAQLFHVLLHTVRRLARGYAGSGWGKTHESHAIGCSFRLFERARDMKFEGTAQHTTALVRLTDVKRDAITRWWDQQLWSKGRARKVNVKDAMAYSAGVMAGNRVDLGKRGLQ